MLLAALVALALATHGQMFTPVIRGIYLASALVHLSDAQEQLHAQNEALANSAEYLKTNEGRKLAAREELEALEPGERVVVIHEPPPSAPHPANPPQQVRVWLAQRAEDAGQSVRRGLDAVKYWLGMGKASSDSPGDSLMEDEGP